MALTRQFTIEQVKALQAESKAAAKAVKKYKNEHPHPLAVWVQDETRKNYQKQISMRGK